MEYTNFIEVVKAEVVKRVGEEDKVRVNDITKNNGVVLNGLTILEKGSNISPTIYLNGFFDAYENGVMTLGTVIDEVMDTYERNRVGRCVNMEQFMKYEHIKRRIVYKLVHAERNAELLKDVPHIMVHDLAVVFQCIVTMEAMGNATVLIHNAHLKLWGIDEKKLYQAAILNTPNLQPYEITPMKEVIKQMLELDEELPMDGGSIPMYVLSNQSRIFGASCILYANVLKNFADKMGSDLHILPSSVHECILMPVSGDEDVDELARMVKEINETQLKPEEVLSDSIYLYSRDDEQLLKLR